MFLIVGDAQFAQDYKYKAWLIGLVNSLGIAERVKFLGFREDVPRIMAAVDCLVHCPIKSDPLPNVVLEAMALQTPVIGSLTGGLPEEIENGVTGLLVEPGNVEALSKAIRMVLENPDMAERFAQAAWHKVRTEFSPEAFARRFETIYAQLLKYPTQLFVKRAFQQGSPVNEDTEKN